MKCQFIDDKMKFILHKLKMQRGGFLWQGYILKVCLENTRKSLKIGELTREEVNGIFLTVADNYKRRKNHLWQLVLCWL